MTFITRVRGNPIALATLLVSVVALVIGSYLGEHSLIGVGLVGAALASTTTLVIDLLSKPRIHDVPVSFQEAALSDFETIKYYRTSCDITIELTGADKIVFSMHSRIRFFCPGGEIVTGGVRPEHRNIRAIESQPHTFNGQIPDGPYLIRKDCSEELRVTYVIDAAFDEISEVHTWKSPVDGYDLKILAPEGFSVSARTLSQRPVEDMVEGSRENRRSYHVDKALFSHQGFRWSIVRGQTDGRSNA